LTSVTGFAAITVISMQGTNMLETEVQEQVVELKREAAAPSRIASIDALRGFDMLWISGGEELIHTLHQAHPTPITNALATQFEHVPWAGFHFYDLIFPLFVFVVGLVLPFSLTRRIEQGGDRRTLYLHAFRRLGLLLLLGLFYNGLLDFNFHQLRLSGVLQRIAIAYFCTTILTMNLSIRKQVIATATILLAYWAIMALVPVPGFGAGVYTPQGNLAAYLDQRLLPRPFCCYVFGDNEGLISMIPAVATCMMGVLAGHWLRSARSPNRKTVGLALAGIASLAVALLWNFEFPIVKNIWSSSFVLFAGGWSLLLLALFYWVIDVLGYQRWAFFFVVIGANSIAIYLAHRFFDFRILGDILIHGLFPYMGVWRPFIREVAGLAVSWCLFLYLYRRRIFLRV
jgi:predicted acyltransferase